MNHLKNESGIHKENIKSILFFHLILLYISPNFLISQTPGSATLTTVGAGTWTVPTGVYSLDIECIGGGGGGGYASTINNASGGGGGGGAYSKKINFSVTPGNTYSYNVGAGGVGGIVASGSSTDGADTWFSSTATVLAKGGLGGTSATTIGAGTGGAGGSSATSIGNIVFSGGIGATGSTTGGGGGGAGANGNANGAAGGVPNGGIGITPGGSGGNGGQGSIGFAGSNYGAGGGGAHRSGANVNGGNGAQGVIIISYTACVVSANATGGGTFCAGSSANLSTPVIPGGIYSWTGPNGFTANTASCIVSGLNASSNGLYTVNVSIAGCGNSANSSTSINVVNNPSFLVNANPSIICTGSSTTLIANGETLDQSQPNFTQISRWFIANTGWQSFKPGITGKLSKLKIKTVTYSTSANITVNIFAGTPGSGSLIATKSYSKPANTNSVDDVIFPNGGPSVTAGSNYYIEIPAGAAIDWPYSTSNPYANGQAYFGNPPNSLPTEDFNFETFIDVNTYVWNPGSLTGPVVNVSPTASTTYTVTATNPQGCVTTNTVIVTVNPNNTASIPLNQSLCIGSSLSPININTTGATGIGTPTGLPAGVTASYTTDLITITGGVTIAGTFNYSIPLTGGCGNVSANGVITVLPNNTLSLSSSPGTNNQVLCAGSNLSPITYTATGATGVNALGLPSGVTSSFSSNILSINGSPSGSGFTTYTVVTTGGCGSAGTSGTINVNTNPVVQITSSVPSNGLVAWYPFNGNGNDISGNSNHLNDIGGVTYTNNRFNAANSAVTFDGSGSNYFLLNNPNFPVGNASRTFSVWYQSNGNFGNSTVFNQWDGNPSGGCHSTFGLFADANDCYFWGKCNDRAVNYPNTTSWNNLTLVYDNNYLKIYKNGILINDTSTLYYYSFPTPLNTQNNEFYVGNGYYLNGSFPSPFNGKIDDIGIWNRPLSQEEISNLCNSNSANLCLGNSISLSATGAATYSWSNGGSTPAITVSPTSSTSYTVVGTDANGCSSGQTFSVNVSTNNNANVSLTAGNSTICQGDTALFTASYTFGGSSPYFRWKINGIEVSGFSSTTFTTTTLNNNDIVSVEMFSNASPCIIGHPVISNAITMTVNLPVTIVSQQNLSQINCLNTPFDTLTITAAGSVVSYQWYKSSVPTFTGNAISGANNNQYQPSSAATGTFYYYCVMNGICNSDTSILFGPFTVNPLVSVSNASSSPVNCISTPVAVITHTLTGSANLGTPSNLPSGITVNLLNDTLFVSGTPIVSGIFNYSIPVTGLCGSDTATGTIQVIQNNTISLVSPIGSNNQTLCYGNAVTNIQYLTTGATGVNFLGLPQGVSGSWNSNTVSISGTPALSGTYTYTISTTGGCGNTGTTGNLTVSALPNLFTSVNTLTSGLVAYYPFNGNANDASGNNFNGNVNNVVPSNDRFGNPNRSFVFNGTNSEIAVPHNSSFNSYPITVSSWVKTAANFDGGSIAYKYLNASWNGWRMTLEYVNPSTSTINPFYLRALTPCTGVIEGYTNCGSPVGMNHTGAVNDGNWHHIVFRVDANGGTLFLDGNQVGQQTWIGTPGSNTSFEPLLIGTSFEGNIDDIGVWNRSLTNEEIGYLYSSSAPICLGNSISLSALGASSYNWSSGSTTSSINVSPSTATSYTVTGTSPSNCTLSETFTVNVNPLLPASVNISSSATSICVGSPVSFTASPGNGGTNPQYQWQINGINSPGDTSANFITSSLSIGDSVRVILTSNATPCLIGSPANSNSLSVNVIQNNTISLLSPIGTDSQTVCTNNTLLPIQYVTIGASGANFSGLPIGATGIWQNDTILISGIGNTPSVSTYTINLTGGCGSTSATGNIAINPILNVTGFVSDALCFGQASGNVNVTVSGGSGTYNYVWSNGTSANTLNGITAGSYSLIVNDGFGCSDTSFYSIGEAAPFAINYNLTNAQCFGDSNGAIDLVVSGGTAPYTFSWSNGASTEDLFNIPAGNYSVDITDNNGCTDTSSTTVSQPSIPILASNSLSLSDTSICEGSSITLTANVTNAGNNPTFQWMINGIVQSNTSGINGNTFVASGLTNGDLLSVLLLSNEICVQNDTVLSNVVSLTVNPLPVTNTVVSSDISCLQTWTQISANSSVNFGNYSWIGPGIVSGNNSTVITVNQGGNYQVIVTDSISQCQDTAFAQVFAYLNPPNVSADSLKLITCLQTIATLNSTSTTPNATFSWNPPGNSPTSPTTQVSNPGSYTVTITDPGNGCIDSAIVQVIANDTLPDISAGLDQTITCSITTVTLLGSSSYSNLNLNWSPPGSSPNTFSTSVNTAGNYILTAVNPNNGCSSSDTVYVTSNVSIPDLNSDSIKYITCLQPNVTISTTSSNTNLSYSWNPPGTSPNQASTQVNVSGTYSITVTDTTNGCTNNDTVQVINTILLPDLLADSIKILTCLQPTTSLNASSITPNISYLWNPPGTSPNQASTQVNATGNYTVTITDNSNGCINSAIVQVISNDTLPNVSASTIQNLTCDSTLAKITGNSSTSNTIVNWNPPGLNPNSFTNQVTFPGTYTLTITDTLTGCSNTASTVVTSDASNCDEVEFYNGITPNADGSNDLFTIRNIEKFPNNTFSLFNRWGIKVWETENYNNTNNVFKGNDANGNELTAGTYFFLLKIENKERKGWLEIIR